MKYVAESATRIGNRPRNQDRVAILESRETVLLVVADGMGGQKGGELAAQTLVESIKHTFRKAPRPVERPRTFISHAIARAHRDIVERGQQHQPPLNPCTTCVVCLVQDGCAWWAHVGDSRLYLFRHGDLLTRTRDHSYVEHLISQRLILPEEAHDHPQRSQLTRCVGGREQPPRVSFSKETVLHSGDTLLLCSDGLWSNLEDQELGQLLLNNRLDEALSNLASKAEQRNYPNSDNISAVALRWLANPVPKSPRVPKAAAPAQAPAPTVSAEPADGLSQAIQAITQALEQYEDELGGPKPPPTPDK